MTFTHKGICMLQREFHHGRLFYGIKALIYQSDYHCYIAMAGHGMLLWLGFEIC